MHHAWEDEPDGNNLAPEEELDDLFDKDEPQREESDLDLMDPQGDPRDDIYANWNLPKRSTRGRAIRSTQDEDYLCDF